MTPKQTKTIAVYGSLRKGHFNHTRFGPMEYLGTGTIKASLRIPYKDASYPHAKLGGDADAVVEVYRLPEDEFAYMDGMERRTGYAPSETDVATENGMFTAVVWGSTLNLAGMIPVAGGDWTAHYKKTFPKDWKRLQKEV